MPAPDVRHLAPEKLIKVIGSLHDLQRGFDLSVDNAKMPSLEWKFGGCEGSMQALEEETPDDDHIW